MSTSIVTEYKELLRIIPDIIEVSGYRNDFIAKKLGMKPQNFSVKKQRGSWSADEVEKLLSVVNNEEVENYIMLQLMRWRKDDENISYEDYKKEIGAWK